MYGLIERAVSLGIGPFKVLMPTQLPVNSLCCILVDHMEELSYYQSTSPVFLLPCFTQQASWALMH